MADEEIGGNDPYSVLAANLSGPEKSILALMQQRQSGVNAQQQKLMEMMQQQESPLNQTGMSDYQKAAMLFQAAGALAQPTRSGGLAGLMEGVGGAGTALAGPLSKADEAQKQRQQQLAQLQLARQKLAVDIAGQQGVSPSDMMSLVKSARDNEEEPETFKRDEVDGKPVLVGSRGTVRPFDYKAAGIDPTAKTDPDEIGIPADVRAKGPEAIKEYAKAYGKKSGEEFMSAQSAADNIKSSLPILKRAEDAYAGMAAKGGIGPYAGSDFMQTVDKYTFGAVQKLREDYKTADAQLQYLKARIEAKGQGAITDYERKILALQLPTFDAQDPETGLETLRMLRQELNSVIEKPQRILQRGSGQPQSGVVPWGSLKK